MPFTFAAPTGRGCDSGCTCVMFPGPFTLSSCTAKGDVHAGEALFLLCSAALCCSEESHQAEVLFVIGMACTR